MKAEKLNGCRRNIVKCDIIAKRTPSTVFNDFENDDWNSRWWIKTADKYDVMFEKYITEIMWKLKKEARINASRGILT